MKKENFIDILVFLIVIVAVVASIKFVCNKFSISTNELFSVENFSFFENLGKES